MLCFILMPKLFWAHIALSYFERYQQLEKLQEKARTTVFETTFMKKTPNWQSIDMHKKISSVFKHSEIFVKEKAVRGSKILESNLMHKTYST